MNIKEAILRIREHQEIHQKKEPRAIKINEAIDMAISALEKQEYFRNCKDCGCLEGNCNHDRCTKFDIGVNPELDGCTFYEDWGV